MNKRSEFCNSEQSISLKGGTAKKEFNTAKLKFAGNKIN